MFGVLQRNYFLFVIFAPAGFWRTVVPVNFSVSSQGNASWVILATMGRYVLHVFAVRGGEEDICQNIFSVRCICHHSDFLIS